MKKEVATKDVGNLALCAISPSTENCRQVPQVVHDCIPLGGVENLNFSTFVGPTSKP